MAEASCQAMTDKAEKSTYWLMKSEPDVYSAQRWEKDKQTLWEGVRNYQARNFMSQQMQVGDTVLFYHSSCEKPGIYAIGKVSKQAEPDPSQFDAKSEYFDEKSTREKPRWLCVQVAFEKHLTRPILLEDIRKEKKLAGMVLLKASRLSIQPVLPEEAKILFEMAKDPQDKKPTVKKKKIAFKSRTQKEL